MRRICLSSAVLFLAAAMMAAAPAAQLSPGGIPPAGHLSVSSTGRIISGSPPFLITSPDGRRQLRYTPAGFSGEFPLNRVELFAGDVPVGTRSGIRGNGFLITDGGAFIAIERPDTDAVPGRITLFRLDGLQKTLSFQGLCSPEFSADQSTLVVRHRDGTSVIDIETFMEYRLGRYDRVTAGGPGVIAAMDGSDGIRIDWWRNGELSFSRRLDFIPRDMAFIPGDPSLWMLEASRMTRLDPSGDLARIDDAPAGVEWVDLHAIDGGMVVGGRVNWAGGSRGSMEIRDVCGRVMARRDGLQSRVPAGVLPDGSTRDDAIPWPFIPNEQHTVGNSYGAYQGFDPNYPYMHPGIDILVPFGEPVYAVRSGVVKAVLTTAADLHWRVAVGDEETSALSPGYLYAHLVESSITVSVGDHVETGQHLGNIVEWVTDFHHLHFARIESSGTTWSGGWRNTLNPHLLLENRTESDPPVFLDSRPGALLAFCDNDSSSYQDPYGLHGAVDIIACVYDRVLTPYESAVQELWYSIYPAGDPGQPVVDNMLAVRFKMELDTYQSGSYSSFLVDLLYKQDSVCGTWFDYDYRVFYHIITNSNGDDIYDENDVEPSWDTSSLPDGDYVIEVTAFDANFNASMASMTVTTINGNPPAPTPTPDTCGSTGVVIEMPSAFYRSGDPCWCQVRVCNSRGDVLQAHPLFVVLDVFGSFYFGPGFTNAPESWINIHPDFDPGETVIEVVPLFTWPATAGSASGVVWHAAMTDPGMTQIVGDWDTFEFGWE